MSYRDCPQCGIVGNPHECPQTYVMQLQAENERLTQRLADAERALGAASECAELLVQIVRPMYAGPSGDQGLNDPRYGACLSAIRRYKEAKKALLAAQDGPREDGAGVCDTHGEHPRPRTSPGLKTRRQAPDPAQAAPPGWAGEE